MSSRGDSAEKLIFSEKADEKSVKKVTCTPNNDNIISLTRLKNYMPKDSLIGPDSLSTSYYLDGTTKECASVSKQAFENSKFTIGQQSANNCALLNSNENAQLLSVTCINKPKRYNVESQQRASFNSNSTDKSQRFETARLQIGIQTSGFTCPIEQPSTNWPQSTKQNAVNDQTHSRRELETSSKGTTLTNNNQREKQFQFRASTKEQSSYPSRRRVEPKRMSSAIQKNNSNRTDRSLSTCRRDNYNSCSSTKSKARLLTTATASNNPASANEQRFELEVAVATEGACNRGDELCQQQMQRINNMTPNSLLQQIHQSHNNQVYIQNQNDEQQPLSNLQESNRLSLKPKLGTESEAPTGFEFNSGSDSELDCATSDSNINNNKNSDTLSPVNIEIADCTSQKSSLSSSVSKDRQDVEVDSKIRSNLQKVSNRLVSSSSHTPTIITTTPNETSLQISSSSSATSTATSSTAILSFNFPSLSRHHQNHMLAGVTNQQFRAFDSAICVGGSSSNSSLYPADKQSTPIDSNQNTQNQTITILNPITASVDYTTVTSPDSNIDHIGSSSQFFNNNNNNLTNTSIGKLSANNYQQTQNYHRHHHQQSQLQHNIDPIDRQQSTNNFQEVIGQASNINRMSNCSTSSYSNFLMSQQSSASNNTYNSNANYANILHDYESAAAAAAATAIPIAIDEATLHYNQHHNHHNHHQHQQQQAASESSQHDDNRSSHNNSSEGVNTRQTANLYNELMANNSTTSKSSSTHSPRSSIGQSPTPQQLKQNQDDPIITSNEDNNNNNLESNSANDGSNRTIVSVAANVQQQLEQLNQLNYSNSSSDNVSSNLQYDSNHNHHTVAAAAAAAAYGQTRSSQETSMIHLDQDYDIQQQQQQAYQHQEQVQSIHNQQQHQQFQQQNASTNIYHQLANNQTIYQPQIPPHYHQTNNANNADTHNHIHRDGRTNSNTTIQASAAAAQAAAAAAVVSQTLKTVAANQNHHNHQHHQYSNTGHHQHQHLQQQQQQQLHHNQLQQLHHQHPQHQQHHTQQYHQQHTQQHISSGFNPAQASNAFVQHHNHSQHHHHHQAAVTAHATTPSFQTMSQQLNHHLSSQAVVAAAAVAVHRNPHVATAQTTHHVTSNSLNHHLGHHVASLPTRKYQCKMCPQVFMSKAEMKYHNQNHMREAKPYKCSQCPKAFANSSYLSQHMRIHQGVKPYSCDTCSRKFTQLSHLQQHKRTHTGDKPYKCTHFNCTKQFSQLSNLQSHSRSHQLDKPFKCNSCYKCFHDERSLLDHIPRHLESKHLKKNLCVFCGSSYQHERGLVKHFQQYHTDKTPTLVAAAIAAGTTGDMRLIASLISSGTKSVSANNSGHTPNSFANNQNNQSKSHLAQGGATSSSFATSSSNSSKNIHQAAASNLTNHHHHFHNQHHQLNNHHHHHQHHSLSQTNGYQSLIPSANQ